MVDISFSPKDTLNSEINGDNQDLITMSMEILDSKIKDDIKIESLILEFLQKGYINELLLQLIRLYFSLFKNNGLINLEIAEGIMLYIDSNEQSQIRSEIVNCYLDYLTDHMNELPEQLLQKSNKLLPFSVCKRDSLVVEIDIYKIHTLYKINSNLVNQGISLLTEYLMKDVKFILKSIEVVKYSKLKSFIKFVFIGDFDEISRLSSAISLFIARIKSGKYVSDSSVSKFFFDELLNRNTSTTSKCNKV